MSSESKHVVTYLTFKFTFAPISKMVSSFVVSLTLLGTSTSNRHSCVAWRRTAPTALDCACVSRDVVRFVARASRALRRERPPKASKYDFLLPLSGEVVLGVCHPLLNEVTFLIAAVAVALYVGRRMRTDEVCRQEVAHKRIVENFTKEYAKIQEQEKKGEAPVDDVLDSADVTPKRRRTRRRRRLSCPVPRAL